MMKKTFTLKLWGFLFFILFAVTACEQDDKVIEKVGINNKEAFFSTEAKLSNYEKALLEGAKKWVPDSTVNKWIEVYGNPEWEKSQLISSENDISILFTTLKNRQEARGLLAIICKNNKIRTQVFSRNFITNSKKGMPLFALFVQMNPSEFPNYTIKEQKTPVQTRSVIFITRCWEVWSGTEGNMKYRHTNCSTQMISMMMHWNSGMDHIGGGGGVGPGGGGGGGTSPNPAPEVDDKEIEGTKVGCVYNKLMNSSNDFNSIIQKFMGEKPVNHLTFKIDYNLQDKTNAETKNLDDFNIAISINGNTLGERTAIGLARTLIHEAIHAEMKRKLISVGYKLDKISFPGIYDYYTRYEDWDHEQMAAHYIKTIADAIEDFDGGIHSRDFYESLAWEGLQKTTSWSSLPEKQRKKIIKVITNNKKNGSKECN